MNKKGIAAALVLLALVAFQATAQDWTLDPTYGNVELAAGFPDDPYEMELTAGGPVNISNLGYSGFVAEAPDVDFYYEAGSLDLTIYVTDTDDDTVLLINDPNGNWRYNDDYDGLDPQITFSNPPSGLFSIWVGTYSDDLVGAVLGITEFSR